MILCKDKKFYKTAARLTAFIALQNVIVCFVGLVDNVMIGAYSQDALSGVALANQVQFLLQMIMNGVGEGMAVIAAQYWGTRRMEPIRRVVAIALIIAAILGALFLGAAQFAPENILTLLTSDAGAIAEGARYMRIVSLSYVFFGATMVLLSAQRSIENVRIGMMSSLTGLVVNIVLNWLLIFGRFGLPRMGVSGAAVATLIARIAEFSVVALFTWQIDKKLAVKVREFLHIDKRMFRDFIRVAVPVVLSGANWGIAQGIQTSILGHMGSSAIAANSIANSLFQVVSVVMYGLASASSVMIGKAVGSDDLDSLKGYVNSLQLMFIGIGLATSAVLFSLRNVVLSFYAVTPEAIDMARTFMNVLCVTVVGSAYQVACLTGIVRGGGNTKFVFYNDLIFQWLIVLPISALCAFEWKLSPVVVFFCLKSDQLTKCLVAIWQVNSYRWVRKVTREAEK
ncbi:MAG: MATE family efflux transporter [Clostridia bacterium]|nr:MATE family efflux transporter [Clostridia bacterium]